MFKFNSDGSRLIISYRKDDKNIITVYDTIYGKIIENFMNDQEVDMSFALHDETGKICILSRMITGRITARLFSIKDGMSIVDKQIITEGRGGNNKNQINISQKDLETIVRYLSDRYSDKSKKSIQPNEDIYGDVKFNSDGGYLFIIDGKVNMNLSQKKRSRIIEQASNKKAKKLSA